MSFSRTLRGGAKVLLRALGIEVAGYPTFAGLIYRGYWIRRATQGARPVSKPFNGYAAFRAITDDNFNSVLDVGSGGGQAAKAFAGKGRLVTCIDLGRSVYFQGSKLNSSDVQIRFVKGDFLKLPAQQTYDLIWASHILEHQANVGLFIKKLLEYCHSSSLLCITVPVSDHRLVGGHLTLWTPGLLVYNLVINGIDCRESRVIEDGREFSVVVPAKLAKLPDLDFDSGDIERLKAYFPPGFCEGQSSLRYW